ncbi:MAG: hypothetical protein Q9162_001905 [Coniocarpon cinnabarinum]
MARTLSAAILLLAHAGVSRAASCTDTFTKISSADWVSGSNPGWNLGNTLDAIPTEGSWGNTADFSTFDDIKNSGFKSLRLPVTWTDHFTGGAPDWTVDPTWLQRVSDVVDAALERDLYVLVNVHHDASDWLNLGAAGADFSVIEQRFYRLWYQIGTQLGCKSSRLAFEPVNEPPASTTDQFAELNKLQGLFVQALADSGGYNGQRVVTLVGPNENGDQTDQYLEPPANMSNPWAVQFHYYSPYDFIFGAWGKTIWGSDADKQALDADLSIVRGNFTDVPIIIGEWSASTTYTEPAARWKYYDAFIRTANKYKISTMLWDNGQDQLDRPAHKWRDPVALDILMNAVAGTSNSLADSTEDLNAVSQQSSAYIFHKVGQPVTDVTLGYLLNGNTLQSITGPNGKLAQGTDYTVDDSNVTYTAAFLSGLLSSNAAPGTKATLTLSFGAGKFARHISLQEALSSLLEEVAHRAL